MLGHQKGLPMFRSPGQKENMQKVVINLDDFKKDVLCRIVFRFYENGEIPTAKKFALELRD
jgi:hypothetical protein